MFTGFISNWKLGFHINGDLNHFPNSIIGNHYPGINEEHIIKSFLPLSAGVDKEY